MTAQSEEAGPSTSLSTAATTLDEGTTESAGAPTKWKDDEPTDGSAASDTTGNRASDSDTENGEAVVDGPNTVTKRSLRRRSQRFEARKVHRLVRHIDPWSMAKFSLVFFLAMWVMMMVAALIVWSIADRAGTIGNIENFFEDLGFKDIAIDGRFYVRGLGLIGLVMTFALSVGSIVAAMVFNLISDIIGGIWITVIEEESARPVPGSPTNSDVG